MGAPSVFQAASRLAATLIAFGVLAALAAPADAAPRGERIAVIDLGPAPDARPAIEARVAAAGFEPVAGDGLSEALSGRAVDGDAIELAAALATAKRAFGDLACGEVKPAANKAIGIAAARQAAGLPVPELTRAWTYLLLCADRENQLDAALTAATRLRDLGGSADVPAGVWAKYPAVDVVANVDLIGIDITTEVPGAAIWVDFRQVGASPLHIAVPAGEHVIAAAAGSKRGWAAGTAVRTQKALTIPMTESPGPASELARRISGWRGAPAPDELAWVLGKVHARVAVIRRGDTIEAWGRVGQSEAPHRLGDTSAAPVADVDRVLAVVAERVRGWDDHAPDPDQPLLTEDTSTRFDPRRRPTSDRPTKWWVYAAIAGAAVIGGAIVIANDSGTDRQRVELHVP